MGSDAGKIWRVATRFALPHLRLATAGHCAARPFAARPICGWVEARAAPRLLEGDAPFVEDPRIAKRMCLSRQLMVSALAREEMCRPRRFGVDGSEGRRPRDVADRNEIAARGRDVARVRCSVERGSFRVEGAMRHAHGASLGLEISRVRRAQCDASTFRTTRSSPP